MDIYWLSWVAVLVLDCNFDLFYKYLEKIDEILEFGCKNDAGKRCKNDNERKIRCSVLLKKMQKWH